MQPLLANHSGKLGQEVPPLEYLLGLAVGNLELATSPEDRLLGAAAEAFGIEDGPQIVIAEDHGVELHGAVDAFAGVRPVANDVSQAVDLFDAARLRIGQHRLEGFEVAMNVADDGTFHDREAIR